MHETLRDTMDMVITMNLKEFGVFFAKLREKSGYESQRQLAEVSGVSHSTINRLESGTHKTSVENLKVLAKYLRDVTPNELLEKSGYIEESDRSNESGEKIKFEELDIDPNINIAYLGGVKYELTPEIAKRLKDDIELFKKMKEQWKKDRH